MQNVAAESETEIPGQIALEPAYPSPFNPSTTIRFSLPESAYTTLTVFDNLGRQIAILIDGYVGAGFHDVVFNVDGLSSGSYFARLVVAGRPLTRLVTLLK